MHRRTLLQFLGGGLIGAVSGCLETEASPSAGTEPGTERSVTETSSRATKGKSTTGECVASPPPKPSTGLGLPGPRSYPEKPTSFEKETITNFLETFEAAYRFNQRLGDLAAQGTCVKYLDMFATETRVTRGVNGFRATVTTQGSYTTEGCPDRTASATATPMHADLAFRDAEYHVTPRQLQREDVIVVCWD